MKYVILYISLFFTLTYVGQFNIEAFVNQNKITVDEYVKYTIKSNERVRLTNLSFENFVIRQGPFTSSSMRPCSPMDRYRLVVIVIVNHHTIVFNKLELKRSKNARL